MENLDVNVDREFSLYRLKLEPGEILIIEIPSKLYFKMNNVQKIVDIATSMLRNVGLNNPVMATPDDIKIGKITPALIEPEPDGFEEGDFEL